MTNTSFAREAHVFLGVYSRRRYVNIAGLNKNGFIPRLIHAHERRRGKRRIPTDALPDSLAAHLHAPDARHLAVVEGPENRAEAEQLRDYAKAIELSGEVVRVGSLRRLFNLESVRGRDRLGQRVSALLIPELAQRVRRFSGTHDDMRRRWAGTWFALAAAFVSFAKVHPQAAAGLCHEPIPAPLAALIHRWKRGLQHSL